MRYPNHYGRRGRFERDGIMTREEFFMYLTIGLIVVAPVVARLYRRATLKKTTQMLRDQFEGHSKDS
jgi:hypothetical protein